MGEEPPVRDWNLYDILGRLGQGGMGVVYEARDKRLDRIVALKFISGAATSRIMRFKQEAEALARIQHSHVCQVYEVGEVQGRPYIAMQRVHGERLDVAAQQLDRPERVRVLAAVARAIHAAHDAGIVHRDLKPSNILVGRGEDGRCFPVVVDFGLAYAIHQGHALTESGQVMGTPPYMPPEQARGDRRAVNERSDVYSLGATLYELLTGRPPFQGSDIRAQVLQEEPVPPRARVRDLDVDLETITLKCLSKEPDRRYPSALALANDLGRYLDGEPIHARRPSLLYRLRLRARKHRALVAVSSASLASTLALAALGTGSWLEARHARQQAEERARLAAQLGQDVRDMEWLLRFVNAQPLHDTSLARRRFREQLEQLAARPHGLGDAGEGLVRYALGLGHLALDEPAEARDALTLARQKGVDTPELHYALGRALGALYQQALDEARKEARRTGAMGGDWLAGRRRELEARYLEPAVASLLRSRGLRLESPHYLEALLAFYGQRYDAAEAAAARALAETPWLYEAWKLAGDVARARAMEHLERGRYELARAGLMRASHLYDAAAEAGRSDAEVHEALAETWMQLLELDGRQGRPHEESLARALESCERGIVATPLRASGYIRKAYILMRQYLAVGFQGGDSQKVRQLLDTWLATASWAVVLAPRSESAHDALGIAYTTLGLHEARHGRDPRPAWERGTAALRQALALEPGDTWALNELGALHFENGKYLRQRGEDPLAEYEQAARYFEEAVARDPSYLFAYSHLIALYNAMASRRLSRGEDPAPEVREALHASARSLAIDGNFVLALNSSAHADLRQAQYLIDTGGNPRPRLERALQHLERSLRINPNHGRTWLARAMLHHLEARHALREHGDAGTALAAGQQALKHVYQYEPRSADCRLEGARLAMTTAAWAKRRGRPVTPALQQALEEARRAVELYPTYPEAHQELARAWWLLTEEGAPGARQGLAAAEHALRLAPNLAQAHALRGALLLTHAGGASPGTACQARESFAQAFRLNPLLRREYEDLERDARRRAGGPGRCPP